MREFPHIDLYERETLAKQMRIARREPCAPAIHPDRMQSEGKIAPEDMVALWGVDENCCIASFRIVKRNSLSTKVIGLEFSAGAVNTGWMVDAFRNPVSLYARLATQYGFASRVVQNRVLRQFQRVDEQTWAFEWADEIGGGR